MILKQQYIKVSQISIISLQVLISSIDYITRLALLITVFIKSGQLYKILDKKFLGLTYIIVYVGAISILFLFVVKKTESGRAPNIEIVPIKKGSKAVGKKKAGFRLDIFKGIILKSIILSNILKSDMNVLNESKIKQYYMVDYVTDYMTITDIEALGYIIYLAYPIITVLIGILLWCVLIGILRISGQ